MNTENRERMPFRMKAETKLNIERWYRSDNCRSQNEFIEKAVNFYSDFLASGRSALLPQAISTSLDGRLAILEKNLSALSFNHAVELDMLVTIIADAFQFEREELQKRRSNSVRRVKNTNGVISLERRVLEKWDEE